MEFSPMTRCGWFVKDNGITEEIISRHFYRLFELTKSHGFGMILNSF
jgi:hypothetical protein